VGQPRTAVVTGASAGVGRATAIALAERGFDVALLARGRQGLDAAARDVEQRGRRALPIEVDVADARAVDAAATQIEDELGPIDVWVNDAMTTVFAWSWDVHPDEWKRATEVTYLGQVHGTLAALARMRPRDRGRIVNVGSALSYVGIPLQGPYCAAKFACRGFFESVRSELLHTNSNVTLSMVHLPAVDTPQFDWCVDRLPNRPQPVAPIYEPDVAARAIVAAALDGRRSSVLGSWNRLVVAATKVAPGVLSHFVARTSVDGQQTDEPRRADRPANLWKPVDDDCDAGARGRFGDDAHGFLTPSFLRMLPSTATQLARAAGDTAREKFDVVVRRTTTGSG
jgi:NAD(P)-dependent dehydrogenase (short-subunit alcohol dehydrogenase family)